MARIPSKSPQPWTPPTERLIGERVLQEKELRGQITQADQAAQQRDERLSTRISELEEEWRKLTDWRTAADQSISGLIGKVRVGGGGRRTIAKVLERDYGITGPIEGGGGSTSEYDTLTDAIAATIPAEVTHVSTAGYATVGDYGGAFYIKVGAEPTRPGKFQSADGAWWHINETVVTPQMFGAVADCNGTAGNGTDDYQAIRDALDCQIFGSGWYSYGAHVFFPHGEYAYRVSQTLELKLQTRMFGAGGAFSPRLVFDTGASGIVINRYNTLNGTTEGTPTTAADYSVIDGLSLKGGGGLDHTVHGIWMRAKAALRDVNVTSFPGNGVQIVATAGGGATVEGNANYWFMERVSCTTNGLHGIFIEGADVNSGTSINCSVVDSGHWGLFDSSFHGNTHIGCHSRDNGMPGKGFNTGAQTSQVYYGGSRWRANWSATEAELVATEPGTDDTIWKSKGTSSGADFFNPLWLPAQVEGTYFPGGAYLADSNNAKGVFLGCYAEGGQAGVAITGPSIAFGGTLDASGFIDGGMIEGTSNTLNATRGGAAFTITDTETDVTASLGAGYVLEWQTSGLDALPWRLTPSITDGTYTLAASGTAAFVLHGTNTTSQFGTGVDVPYIMQFSRLALGTGADARVLRMDNAAPTTGAHARGEIYWNDYTGAGDGYSIMRGWVCITAGTPGTWLPFTGGLLSQETRSTDANSSITSRDSSYEILHTGTLTAARTITLNTSNAVAGMRFRITRTGGGEFKLIIGSLTSLSQGQWCDIVFDGSAWYLAGFGTAPGYSYQTISTDAAFTIRSGSARETKHTGTLTANRAVSLSTTNAIAGDTKRITRTGAGAFTLDVGTGPLKSLATNTWGEFVYDGAAWYLAAYGAL